MSDSSILVLEPAGATAEIDAEQISASGPGGKPLRRERLQVAGAALAEIARVLNAAPAGSEYALVVRPIMPASTTVDVSDRDARLAGRVKLFDSLGNVIDPALKAQLPAALVSGRLDVNLGAAPVTVTVDESDRAARDVGRVRWWDGTNIAAVKAASTAPLLADPAGVVAISPNSYQFRPTYRAVYRLAARPYALSNAFGAAGRKQYATLHHAATAVKKVRVRRVVVLLESSSAAGIVMADLVFLTAAPATGNPAITPTPMNRGDAAAEAVALALPTTAGTEGALIATAEWNLGITGAGSAVNPPPPLSFYELYSEDETSVVGDVKSVELRAGTLEGVAVALDASAAITVKGYAIITFTEE